jgi:hypothetical protein
MLAPTTSARPIRSRAEGRPHEVTPVPAGKFVLLSKLIKYIIALECAE